MTTPEGKVKNQIKAWLKEIGAYQYWPVPFGYSAPMVDCIVCYKGHFVVIEVKRLGVEQATPRQQACLHEIEKHDGKAICTDSLLKLQLQFSVWFGDGT